ncbi:hypothetical protein H490_0105135 [Leucobacter sp. UCD-THU]|nr:hypothetical protein H490_0105135 [Leucobacter sp. UCD-THU]
MLGSRSEPPPPPDSLAAALAAVTVSERVERARSSSTTAPAASAECVKAEGSRFALIETSERTRCGWSRASSSPMIAPSL